jgi:hypothetical protein
MCRRKNRFHHQGRKVIHIRLLVYLTWYYNPETRNIHSHHCKTEISRAQGRPTLRLTNEWHGEICFTPVFNKSATEGGGRSGIQDSSPWAHLARLQPSTYQESFLFWRHFVYVSQRKRFIKVSKTFLYIIFMYVGQCTKCSVSQTLSYKALCISPPPCVYSRCRVTGINVAQRRYCIT